MRTAIAVLVIALAVPVSADTLEGEVVKIVDADTIDVLDADKTTHRVRLHGIDAPEAGAPFSKKAKQALADLVHEKQVVVDLNEDKDLLHCPTAFDCVSTFQ